VSYYLHPAAEKEYLEEIAYLESRSPGLGASLLIEFEQVLSDICEAPGRYRIEMEPDIRRKSLKRFPIIVLYREIRGQVQVLAVAHKRRRPQYWLERT
jgi:toxin ParE1/3/4